MTDNDPKDDLARYLAVAHDAVLWKLDGVSDHDARRPLTPTGTNLLGLVKHLAAVEAGYLGATFGRPFPEPLPDVDADPEADLWVTADESRAQVLAFHQRVRAHAGATMTALDLDAVGSVPWWPAERREVTLHRVLVHMVAEVNRHAGHADVLRETLDGAAGLRDGRDNLGTSDAAARRAHHERVQAAADQYR